MPIIRIQGAEEKAAGIYYEVDSDERELGTGGMGQVRRGICVNTRNGIRSEVAIKFLFDDLPPSTVERARREAMIRIHNDNVVNMLGFIESEENGIKRYHVVSELLRGVMLYDVLKGTTTDSEGNSVAFAQKLSEMRAANPELFALTIMKGVLSGVMALHDKGYIHRDIDPSNIMITTDGKIKLLDFGIAKNVNAETTADHQFTSAGVFMGKAGYAAPELVLGDVNNQNESTDIYALGIVLFQLLTGRLPFEGAANEVMQMQCKNKIPLKEIRNKELRKIVEKATEKKQSDRYRTVSSMRVALEEAEIKSNISEGNKNERVFTSSGSRAINSANTSDSENGPAKNKRRNIIAVAAIVTIIIGICAGVFIGIDKKREQERITQMRAQATADSIAAAKEKKLQEERSKSWADRISEKSQSKDLSDLIAASNGEGNKSAEAAYLYGGILARQSRVLPESIINRYAESHPEDLSAAHVQYEKALNADSTFYKAAYEVGFDYAMGNGVDIDLEKAVQIMKSGLIQAKSMGDKEYENLFENAIEKIGL